MCGIAGYVGEIGNQETLSKMLSCIKHRGPDDVGLEIIGECGIGQARLAIIDLSPTGHQPMFSIDNRYSIVFNGEIYNYPDIKSKLVTKYKFRGTSDTEVLLNAYIEWGIDCLQHLNGMFSFVIYDSKENVLFGARDRLGEKPFKYFYDGKNFIFASEIKAILSALPNKPTIDLSAISEFLTLQYISGENTGFENIKKLPPAHYFIYKSKKLHIYKYWEPRVTIDNTNSSEEWEKTILEELDRSVRMRLISDVPVGALLSGGVDSSAVVAFMAKNSKDKIKTFNIGFDNLAFDESCYANQIAKQYDTEHTTLKLTKNDMLQALPKVIDQYDEPLADNSILPTYLVSELTSKSVKVALVGDGGDENFAGYERYNFLYFANIYNKVPTNLRKSFLSIFNRLVQTKNTKLLYRIERFLISGLTEKKDWNQLFNTFFLDETKNSILGDNFIRITGRISLGSKTWNDKLDLITNALQTDILNYLPNDLLQKTDIASMAHGLELRAPLLDHALMEKFFSMPSKYKADMFDKKILFKKALVKNGILPKSLVYRKKKGFVIPINSWFKSDLKDFVKDSILSSSIRDKGYFNTQKLEDFVNGYFENKHCSDNEMFALLVLSRWLSKYD